jgi:hypothetical protein
LAWPHAFAHLSRWLSPFDGEEAIALYRDIHCYCHYPHLPTPGVLTLYPSSTHHRHLPPSSQHP